MNHTKASSIIYKLFKKYSDTISRLPSFNYNNTLLYYNSINTFNKTSKHNNDLYNKIRENVIGAILNNKVPSNYYDYSLRWNSMKKNLHEYICLLIKNVSNNKDIVVNSIQCIHKGGRGANNDFDIIINDCLLCPVEFKFNAMCVLDCPQFVSLGKPSLYLDNEFESWFYDNYLSQIVNYYKTNNDINDNTQPILQLPDKDTYVKTIGNNNVDCMKTFKELYKSDPCFYKFCKMIDKKAIKEFILLSNLNISLLSEKLSKSQSNKHYMCYKNNVFYYDTLNPDLYSISDVCKKEPTNFICNTKSGYQLEVKLRFKNGCGLLFPSFQIKQKIPSIKELKTILKNHGFNSIPRLKNDILNMLNENHIVY